MNKILTLILINIFCFHAICHASAVKERQEQKKLMLKKKMMIQQQALTQRIMKEQRKALEQEVQNKYRGAISHEVQQKQKMMAQEAIAVKRAAQAKAMAAQVGAAKRIMAETMAIQKDIVGQQRVIMDGVIDGEIKRAARSGKIPLPEKEEITIVSADQLLDSLKDSSKIWNQIIDFEAKESLVEHYKQEYREDGIYIRKTSAHYARMIDDMSKNNPGFLLNPFDKLLKLMVIMEYDFDNGQNPDLLAQKFLSPEVYEANRKRLGGMKQ